MELKSGIGMLIKESILTGIKINSNFQETVHTFDIILFSIKYLHLIKGN